MQSHVEAACSELLPLIDIRILNDWSADLTSADVQGILGRFPEVCGKGIYDIEKAITAGNQAAIGRAAHYLKGMAGSLGAARLAHMARGIELGTEAIADVTIVKLKETMNETLEAFGRLSQE